MSAWARPGVKCVCVDSYMDGEPPVLVEGAVYQVARVISDNGTNTIGRYAGARQSLVLVGLINPYDERYGSFALARFRPIVTRTQEQDVAIFRPLLNTICEDA